MSNADSAELFRNRYKITMWGSGNRSPGPRPSPAFDPYAAADQFLGTVAWRFNFSEGIKALLATALRIGTLQRFDMPIPPEHEDEIESLLTAILQDNPYAENRHGHAILTVWQRLARFAVEPVRIDGQTYGSAHEAAYNIAAGLQQNLWLSRQACMGQHLAADYCQCIEQDYPAGILFTRIDQEAQALDEFYEARKAAATADVSTQPHRDPAACTAGVWTPLLTSKEVTRALQFENARTFRKQRDRWVREGVAEKHSRELYRYRLDKLKESDRRALRDLRESSSTPSKNLPLEPTRALLEPTRPTGTNSRM